MGENAYSIDMQNVGFWKWKPKKVLTCKPTQFFFYGAFCNTYYTKAGQMKVKILAVFYFKQMYKQSLSASRPSDVINVTNRENY